MPALIKFCNGVKNMQEFIIYDRDTGIDGEKVYKKHPWLFRFPYVRICKTKETKWQYLPFKTLIIAEIDKIEDVMAMMQVSPTVSFNFNNLGFPRIELD